MKILVTGASGFIGTNLLPFLASIPEVQAFTYDIKNGRSIDDLQMLAQYSQGVDVIIHLAAETDALGSVDNPQAHFWTNVRGTINVLDAAMLSGKAHVVFVSSGAARSCANPYGASKASAEAYCRMYASLHNLPVTILRLSNVYGPHSWEKKSVVASFCRNAVTGEPLQIFGESTRNFVHVDDVCRAIMIAGYTPGFYHTSASPGHLVPISQIAEMVEGMHDDQDGICPIQFQRFPERVGDIRMPPVPEFDILPGWEPQECIKTGLLKTYSWFASEHTRRYLASRKQASAHKAVEALDYQI